jgi:hypothetical protein
LLAAALNRRAGATAFRLDRLTAIQSGNGVLHGSPPAEPAQGSATTLLPRLDT